MSNLTDNEAAEKLYGPTSPDAKPTPVSRDPNAPYAAEAERVYRDSTLALHPAEQQALAQHHDTLTGILNLDRETRETLVRQVSGAFAQAGLGLYDHGLFPILAERLVSHEVATVRGAPFDEAAEAADYEDTLRELRGVYGDDVAEDLVARTNRWLARQPQLHELITRARAGSHPAIVKALVEHVRAEDLR